MAEQSEKGAYKFLPIECPNCGFQGKVNISRLDQTFHCKECSQVFHVTKDGTVAGERPIEAASIDHAAPLVEEKPNWLEQKFVALPPAVKWGVLGVFALILVYGLVKFFEPAEPLPDDLEDRVKLAAKSFATGDWSTLKRLAGKGTARDLGQWYDKQRPEEWNDVPTEEFEVKVAGVKRQLVKYVKTTPVTVVFTKVEISAPTNSGSVEFVWDETESSEYWLKGDRMLKESRLIKKKPQPDAPAEEDAANEEGAADAQ